VPSLIKSESSPITMRYVSALLLVAASGSVCRCPCRRSDPQHSAECVAALEVEARAMADQYRAGTPTSRRNWSGAFSKAFAFIGTAYLQGVRDAEADRLLKAAEAAQKDIPVD
jgi:hypothetical protein